MTRWALRRVSLVLLLLGPAILASQSASAARVTESQPLAVGYVSCAISAGTLKFSPESSSPGTYRVALKATFPLHPCKGSGSVNGEQFDISQLSLAHMSLEGTGAATASSTGGDLCDLSSMSVTIDWHSKYGIAPTALAYDGGAWSRSSWRLPAEGGSLTSDTGSFSGASDSAVVTPKVEYQTDPCAGTQSITMPLTGGSVKLKATAITRASGFPVDEASEEGFSSPATFTIDPQHVGDLLIVIVEDVFLTSVSGGGGGTWQRVIDTPTGGAQYVDMWWAVATSTGEHTLTITFSATTTPNGPVIPDQFIIDSLTVGPGYTWGVVTTGAAHSLADTTDVPLPSLTSGPKRFQAWIGYAWVGLNSTAKGTPSTFTFDETTSGSCYFWNLSLAPSKTYSPTTKQTGDATSQALSAIFVATKSA